MPDSVLGGLVGSGLLVLDDAEGLESSGAVVPQQVEGDRTLEEVAGALGFEEGLSCPEVVAGRAALATEVGDVGAGLVDRSRRSLQLRRRGLCLRLRGSELFLRLAGGISGRLRLDGGSREFLVGLSLDPPSILIGSIER